MSRAKTYKGPPVQTLIMLEGAGQAVTSIEDYDSLRAAWTSAEATHLDTMIAVSNYPAPVKASFPVSKIVGIYAIPIEVQ